MCHFFKTAVIIFSFFLVKAEQFSNEVNSSPKKQIKCESSKEPQQHSKSLAHKIGEPSSPSISSKLTLLKTKEEHTYKEMSPLASKRKENAIELKGETKTPKKAKGSPSKKEVEIF